MSDYETGLDDLPLFAMARDSDKETSHQAAEEVATKLSGLRAVFVSRLRQIGRPATANEVAQRIESIRKRAKECERLGLIKAVGTKTCTVTGKTATVYLEQKA